MSADLDRGEQPGLMEPLLISEGSRHRSHLTDLAFELAGKATGLRRSLPAGIHDALADLVRAMNCYYSNLIEGHDTHPVDIERALRNDYSADPHQRALQLEATAHIAVQQWIDADGLAGTPASTEAICAIHRRFGELLPEELLRVTNPETGEVVQMVPGQIRHQDVRVGRHIAVSPGALPRFLKRFEDVYGRLGRSEVVLGAAAAHHRLLWIHPFLDGNGRVARLVSHGMLRQALDTGGIWSVARGLARNSAGYKAHLANCDLPRRNDLDGRGSLSEEALADFTAFFLELCLDQVGFMEDLVQPDQLRGRILYWAGEEARLGRLSPKAGTILEALLYRGSLPRGDLPALLGVTDRHARRIVAELVELDVLVSPSSRAPLQLAFPARLAHRWMPGLFPEKGS